VTAQPFITPIDLAAPSGAALLDAVRQRNGAALTHALDRFARIFRLRSPDADNLVFVGAQVALPPDAEWPMPHASVGGTGRAVEAAFTSCIGEGVELLSQFESAGDIAESASIAAQRAAIGEDFAHWIERHVERDAPAPDAIDWILGTDLATGRPIPLPADLCLRRKVARVRIAPRALLSIGCAAGPTPQDALLRGILELIERDAATLWWVGGRPPVGLAFDSPAALRATALLAELRGSARNRITWLLDIATEIGVPVVAAVSIDETGRGFACGMAARLDQGDAAEAAVLEMMQVELAYVVMAAKLREGGESALAPADRRHMARASEIDAADCPLIHSQGPPRRFPDWPADTGERLATLLAALQGQGVRVACVDLTRQALGLPVIRALAPALHVSVASPMTRRLAEAMHVHGGGARFTRGVDLF
jgi:ribosomal protein S12 methylthiotransferase accessory factor